MGRKVDTSISIMAFDKTFGVLVPLNRGIVRDQIVVLEKISKCIHCVAQEVKIMVSNSALTLFLGRLTRSSSFFLFIFLKQAKV